MSAKNIGGGARVSAASLPPSDIACEFAEDLFSSINEFVWCTSADGRELMILTEAAERIYGIPLDDLRSHPDLWRGALHPEDKSLVERELQNAPNNRRIELEYRILRPDGETRWLRDRIRVLGNESGTPPCIGGIVTDISEQKLAEQALDESHAAFNSLAERLPLNVLRKDLEGRIVFANQNCCRALKRSLAELIGKTDFDLFPEELATKYRQDDLNVVESSQDYRDVEEHQTSDGEARYVEVMKGPVIDAGGMVRGIQCIFWDVTDRVRVEQAMEHEQRLLNALMDNLPDSIYFKDEESRFLRISQNQAKRYGLSDPAEAIGKSDADIFTEEHARSARNDELEIMRTGRGMEGKVEHLTWPDRPDRWSSTTKLPLYDQGGRVIGTFGVCATSRIRSLPKRLCIVNATCYGN